MTDDMAEEMAALQQRIEALERMVFAPRCTCTFWTASIPPMPESDGTCPVHPVRGLWRDGKPPKVAP